MPAKKISIEKAKKHKLFYFVANVVVYRDSDKRCLILKRDDREKVHPGRYCVPGGKLEWKDLDIKNPTRLNKDVLDFENAVEDLLKREVLEEAGIEIEDGLKYINSVAFVRPDEIPVVLVKFAAKCKNHASPSARQNLVSRFARNKNHASPSARQNLVSRFARNKNGEVKLEKGAFTDFVWVNREEIKKYECIDGLPEEVEKTIRLFS